MNFVNDEYQQLLGEHPLDHLPLASVRGLGGREPNLTSLFLKEMEREEEGLSV